MPTLTARMRFPLRRLMGHEWIDDTLGKICAASQIHLPRPQTPRHLTERVGGGARIERDYRYRSASGR